jgi:hypothetical protein
MTQLSTAPPPTQPDVQGQTRRGFFKALEIDLRVFGMVVALVLIFVGFGLATDGRFLRPVNLVNLAVQSVSVAIIATGMTMVIVARQIDLSVGSIVGVVGMTYAYLMARVLPDILGFGNPWIWVIALAAGLTLGSLIGALQGFIVAYVGVPSFVVCLGWPGRGNADGQDGAFASGSPCRVHHAPDDCVRPVLGLSLAQVLVDDVEVVVDAEAKDFGSAKVQADDVFAHAREASTGNPRGSSG